VHSGIRISIQKQTTGAPGHIGLSFEVAEVSSHCARAYWTFVRGGRRVKLLRQGILDFRSRWQTRQATAPGHIGLSFEVAGASSYCAGASSTSNCYFSLSLGLSIREATVRCAGADVRRGSPSVFLWHSWIGPDDPSTHFPYASDGGLK
jgi:hypothetical protein